MGIFFAGFADSTFESSESIIAKTSQWLESGTLFGVLLMQLMHDKGIGSRRDPRSHDIGNQTQRFHGANGPPGNIEFKPSMSMSGATLISVMIVVPAFAEG